MLVNLLRTRHVQVVAPRWAVGEVWSASKSRHRRLGLQHVIWGQPHRMRCLPVDCPSTHHGCRAAGAGMQAALQGLRTSRQAPHLRASYRSPDAEWRDWVARSSAATAAAKDGQELRTERSCIVEAGPARIVIRVKLQRMSGHARLAALLHKPPMTRRAAARQLARAAKGCLANPPPAHTPRTQISTAASTSAPAPCKPTTPTTPFQQQTRSAAAQAAVQRVEVQTPHGRTAA